MLEITSTGSYTLTNIDFTGYGADASNSAAIYNDSGGSVTLTISGGTTPTIRNGTGASTTLVLNPVSTQVTVTDNNGAALQNARVIVEASSGAGDLPFEDTVTITRSGTTASVSHTAHGLTNGDKVAIRGANEQAYNGVFAITNVTTNAYDYTVSGSPGTPATGTITSTGVVVEGLTNVSGVISASRAFTLDQPVKGFVRKSTSPGPYFQTFRITGTVDSDTGLSIAVRMILDE